MSKTVSAPPDAAMVARRAFIIGAQIAKARAAPPPDTLVEIAGTWSGDDRAAYGAEVGARAKKNGESLREARLWDEMSEDERTFMAVGEPTEQQYAAASLLPEAAACLLWALGHIAAIPSYDEMADSDLILRLPQEPLERLAAAATLRSAAELATAREAAQRWNWRARTRYLQEQGEFDEWRGPKGITMTDVIRMSAELAAADGLFAKPIGNDYPAFGKAYGALSAEEWSTCHAIAEEFHRALNWLCGLAPGNRWSETPTET